MKILKSQREVALVAESAMKGLGRWKRHILSHQKLEAVEEVVCGGRRKARACLTPPVDSG